ncbi:MAG: hypothetical protein R3C99_20675 [Pirellulaceae bacterium]
MNDNAPSRHEPSASIGKTVVSIGVLVLLPFIYLLVAPWLMLLLAACFPSLTGDNSLARTLEWFMYPAVLVAERVELYGDYLWYVLSPLGG